MRRFSIALASLFLATSCSSDPSPSQATETSAVSASSTLPASGDTGAAFESLNNTWSTALTSANFAEVDACPVSDWIRLLKLMLDNTESETVVDALSGQHFTFVDTDRQQLPYSACEFNGDGDGSAGLLFEAAPQSLVAHAEDFADVGNTDVVLDISETKPALNGTLGTICGSFDLSPRTDYCSVVWFDETLLIEAFVRGEGANEIDIGPLASGFQDALPSLLEQLAGTEG